MKSFDKKMQTFFDIEHQEEENIGLENTPVIFESFEKDLKNDYEKTRENLSELIDKGKQAFEDILSIARETEKGRDFEVAATMLKTVIEANEKTLLLHKQIREISNYRQANEDKKTTINNTLFVGSTAELSKLIKQMNNEILIEN